MRTLFSIGLSLATLALTGCKEIEAPVVVDAEILYSKSADGIQMQNPLKQPLSGPELALLNAWLKKSVSRWRTHNATTTLMPSWCISGFKPTWEVQALCRYGNSIVAIAGPNRFEYRIETSSDDLPFAAH